jgi:ferritin-like metal-binding protein YciE
MGAGSRVEYYEMAGYLIAIRLAERIGEKQAVSLLKQSLAEEMSAEDKLRKIAVSLIESAPTEEAAA